MLPTTISTVIKSKLSNDICICYDSCSFLTSYDLLAPGQEYIALPLLHSIDDVIDGALLFQQVTLQLAPIPSSPTIFYQLLSDQCSTQNEGETGRDSLFI